MIDNGDYMRIFTPIIPLLQGGGYTGVFRLMDKTVHGSEYLQPGSCGSTLDSPDLLGGHISKHGC